MNNDVSFNLKTICDGHHKTLYRGVECLKCPFDYVIYQMIVSKLKPDLIIEIGTNHGGGALYLADLLEINNNGVIHTIDIEDKVSNELVINHPRIKRFFGGYESYMYSGNYNKIIVIDDGSHTYSDVLHVLNKFKTIVSSDSYFIIEDGILNELGYDGYYMTTISAFHSEVGLCSDSLNKLK
jgi:cephalosporin hydroxylase